MDSIMDQAIQEANEIGALGRDNTPFVLKRIRELSAGESVGANRALVEANVVRGTKVAVELAQLDLSAE